MSFKWTADLTVGVDTMDEQHKELFKLINELHDCLTAECEKSETFKAIEFLENYINDHFKMEQAYMEKHSYPAISEHLAQHTSFITDLKEFRKQLEAGLEPVHFSKIITNWLVYWWRHHISNTDKQLGKFLKDKI